MPQFTLTIDPEAERVLLTVFFNAYPEAANLAHVEKLELALDLLTQSYDAGVDDTTSLEDRPLEGKPSVEIATALNEMLNPNIGLDLDASTIRDMPVAAPIPRKTLAELEKRAPGNRFIKLCKTPEGGLLKQATEIVLSALPIEQWSDDVTGSLIGKTTAMLDAQRKAGG